MGRSKRVHTIHCGNCDNCGIAVVNPAMSSAMVQSRNDVEVEEKRGSSAVSTGYVGVSFLKGMVY